MHVCSLPEKGKQKKKTEENDAKHPSQTDSTLEEAHVFFS